MRKKTLAEAFWTCAEPDCFNRARGPIRSNSPHSVYCRNHKWPGDMALLREARRTGDYSAVTKSVQTPSEPIQTTRSSTCSLAAVP